MFEASARRPYTSPFRMSEPILVPPANPCFDLERLVKEAIKRQNDDQCPPSPTMSEASSSLPSLTPSPELHPLHISVLEPSPFLLDNINNSINSAKLQFHFLSEEELKLNSLPRVKKPLQKKKSDKKKPSNRQARQNAAGNAAKKKRRLNDLNHRRENGEIDCVEARPEARLKHLGAATAIPVNQDIQTLPVASTGYIGLGNGFSTRQSYTLDDMVGKSSRFKFRLQKWDGSFSAALVNAKNRVIGVLAGHPDDKKWPLLQAEAAKALETRRSQCWVPKEFRRRPHRRGKFVALNCGVSHGGGQRLPGNLNNHPDNQRVLSELNSLEPFRRVAGFATSVMETWMPKLHQYYKTYRKRLHTEYPSLVKIFPESVFSAVSYNLGPQTVCYPHTDDSNLVFGTCSVTPFGLFDYTKGGHLILWDLHLVIEFPPGCTILLPSALVSHSNVAIAKGESRYLFAQYTAGSLFQWVDQHFQTKKEYMDSLSPAQLIKEQERLDGMWEFGLSLLPTVSSTS